MYRLGHRFDFFRMLSELGFPSQFITWIIECVTTVSYSILLNGKPTIPFPSKKGVRQGDPMSPFLFAIGMEYLSRCLLELTLNPNFNYHPRCEKLAITHMMFASDLLLFSRADTSSVILLYQAFQRNLQAARQPLVPLLFGALLYFLPYFPNLEWLEGWIEGLDLFLLLLGFLLFVCGEENE